MTKAACGVKTAGGGQCRAFALPSGRCWNHDPARADERYRAQAKGGKLRALHGRRRKLDRAAELVSFTADLVHRLLAAELEVDVVRTCVYALSLQHRLIEKSDLEQRLEALDQRLRAVQQQLWIEQQKGARG